MDEMKTDSGTLFEILVRLLNTAEDSTGVMPYEEASVPGVGKAYVTPDGDERIAERYISGYALYAYPYKLSVRYANVTPADRLDAVSALRILLDAALPAAGEAGITLTPCGDVVQEMTGESTSVFSLLFEASRVERRGEDGDVCYYVSFDGVAKHLLGAGVTRFEETLRSKLWRRRYIHELNERCDVTGAMCAFEFEAVIGCGEGPLESFIRGTETSEVYRVHPDGSAERTHCVLAALTVENGVCRGTLESCCGTVMGTFDPVTGAFTEVRGQ